MWIHCYLLFPHCRTTRRLSESKRTGCGPLRLTRAFRRPWPSTLLAAGEKSSWQMRGKCMVSLNTLTTGHALYFWKRTVETTLRMHLSASETSVFLATRARQFRRMRPPPPLPRISSPFLPSGASSFVLLPSTISFTQQKITTHLRVGF